MLLDFFPSRTLTWYLGKTFMIRIVAVLVMLVLVLMMLDLLSNTGEILAHPGNGEAELMRYVSLRVPQLVARFLPYSAASQALRVDVARVTIRSLNTNETAATSNAARMSGARIWCAERPAAFIATTSLFWLKVASVMIVASSTE